MRHARTFTLLRILLALVALAGLAYWAADTRDRFSLGLHPERFVERPFTLVPETRQVDSVRPEAAQAGLNPGATIDSLNGAAYAGYAQYAAALALARPGDQLLVGFRPAPGSPAAGPPARAGSPAGAGIPADAGIPTPAGITLVAHHPDSPPSLSQAWQQFALLALLPLACMLIGYWLVFVKPGEPNAWLLLVLLALPAVLFSPPLPAARGAALLLRGAYYNVLQLLGPIALLPFAIYFPERSRIDARAPWLKWVVLVPAFACSSILLLALYQGYTRAQAAAWLLHSQAWASVVENAVNLLCVVLYLVILAEKLRSASTADARRRLRVLLTGTGIGLAALLLIFILLPHLGYSPAAPQHRWVAFLGLTVFLIAPLTLAYVVLVQRAMDVSILVRQGTRYALAKASVRVVQGVLIWLFAYTLLLPALVHRQQPQSQWWKGPLFLLLLLGVRLVFRKRPGEWVDRKFFREAYDSELVLAQLSEDVRKYNESGPMLAMVTDCVSTTLHIPNISMLQRSGKSFVTTHGTVAAPASDEPLALPATSSTIRFLSRSTKAAPLYRENPDAWYMLADASEQSTLDALGAELLLPLPGRARLMGVMVLGPKQSEAAYSKSDLHLLQMLATQTGMALEVSELAHSLADEAALRERTSRELEIAREVQERLFPQGMPSFVGGSIAGACRPAQGVGGDYYDVFPLPDGRVGLAIGDVSGKGISAALLMAGLRASLRGLLLDPAPDFAALMGKVNRLVYESSADNRYATFFFGALDPGTRLLECVNAGHNAPLILRNGERMGPAALRIEADGPVVGLLPYAAYTAQRIQLQPGDLLVSYTDGISEAMTHAEEEWGEDRMVAAAAHAPVPGAEHILHAIFAGADRFTAGAPQHDDMSLLILQLDPSHAAVQADAHPGTPSMHAAG